MTVRTRFPAIFDTTQVTWTTDDAHSGSAAIRLTDLDQYPGGAQSVGVPAAPLPSYAASTWVKTAPGGGAPHAQLYLEFIDATGVRVGVCYSDVATTASWQPIATTCSAPLGAATVDVSVYSGQLSLGSWYADDVSLQGL